MMKKIGVKGITCTLLATFLFLSVGPSLVMAEEMGSVCFYENEVVCFGASWCCYNFASNKCCKNDKNPAKYGFSAEVIPPRDIGETTLYKDQTCSDSLCTGSGYLCCQRDGHDKFNSGKWTAIGRRDGAELGSEKPCNKTVSTDTLQYTFITEDRRRASWMLPMASLTEADSNGPLRDLPAEEQVIWFKSRGATLKVEDHQTTPVADYNAYSPAAGLTLDSCSGN